MTAALEGGEWSAARPGRTLPPGKTWYRLYRRLGGPQGRSGRAENLVPTGTQSQTVQPTQTELPNPHTHTRTRARVWVCVCPVFASSRSVFQTIFKCHLYRLFFWKWLSVLKKLSYID